MSPNISNMICYPPLPLAIVQSAKSLRVDFIIFEMEMYAFLNYYQNIKSDQRRFSYG